MGLIAHRHGKPGGKAPRTSSPVAGFLQPQDDQGEERQTVAEAVSKPSSSRKGSALGYGTYLARRNPTLPIVLTYWVSVAAVGVKTLPRFVQVPPGTGVNSS